MVMPSLGWSHATFLDGLLDLLKSWLAYCSSSASDELGVLKRWDLANLTGETCKQVLLCPCCAGAAVHI